MVKRLALIGVIVLLAAQGRVQAYTDPGSGTLILQMLGAAALGLLFYLRRIKLWVTGLRGRKPSPKSEPAQAGEGGASNEN